MDNIEAPSYARVLKDGTCRVIWRNVLNNGFNMSDKTVDEYPFTNGAFYINKTINLYLKRQDPYNYWGLYSSNDIKGANVNIDEEDNYVKAEDIEC
jgi:protein involved in sex pheromone biosynthesis